MTTTFSINQDDRLFIDRLRGLSIIRVVLVHLGLSWFFTPYSQFILVFLPILFFVSGAVSFPVFLRANGALHYGVKRLSSVVVPYYVIVSFIIAFVFIFFSAQYKLTLDGAIRWLFISPTNEISPFPLGQVWFIRALVVISLISIPVFVFAKKNAQFLLVPILASFFAVLWQTYEDFHKYFYVDFFNMYQPIANAGYFFLGSYYYANKHKIGAGKLWILAVASLAISGFSFFHASLSLNMAEHAYAPNLYYFGMSLSVIFIVILAKPLIQSLLNSIRVLDFIVLQYSKHAYSVFIIHSLMIYLSEVIFGWEDLMQNPVLALCKILFVLSSSLIVSIPITAITQSVSKAMVRNLYGS